MEGGRDIGSASPVPALHLFHGACSLRGALTFSHRAAIFAASPRCRPAASSFRLSCHLISAATACFISPHLTYVAHLPLPHLFAHRLHAPMVRWPPARALWTFLGANTNTLRYTRIAGVVAS